MLDFPRWFEETYYIQGKMYICVHWADNKRRDIYARLKKDGFTFRTINGTKVLIKRV